MRDLQMEPMEQEQDWIRRAQRGDVRAYDALARAYETLAFRAAYLITRDEHEAADAAQDAFVRAYRALNTFRAGEPFRPSHPPSPPTPLPTGEGRETQIPPSSTESGAGGEGTATPRPIAMPTVKSFTLCCETTLQDALRRAHFQLLAPPHETPSRVYYQNIFDSAEQVVMVFGDPENPRFTLYQARRWIYAKMIGKFIHTQTVLGEARVQDARALWFSGAPHIVALFNANGSIIYDTQRVVDANTLVWETGDADMGIIYRVETRGSLEDAVRFAESLAPRQAEEP